MTQALNPGLEFMILPVVKTKSLINLTDEYLKVHSNIS